MGFGPEGLPGKAYAGNMARTQVWVSLQLLASVQVHAQWRCACTFGNGQHLHVQHLGPTHCRCAFVSWFLHPCFA
jgi:hypothetical protein